MSKLSVTMLILCLLFTTTVVTAQHVGIKKLSENINSEKSQTNFIQINDTLAYFTEFFLKDQDYQAQVFAAINTNGFWKRKGKIDFGEFFSSTNISVDHQNKDIYYTACDKDSNCKIAVKRNNRTMVLKNEFINTADNNTQPNICFYLNQKTLYFVSDRPGGYGENDIWFSIVDAMGNFGKPINAGPKINSKYNEVTPFYNKYEGALYFSSDRKTSLGGYDIFRASGHTNLWSDIENTKELNSPQDDLYCSFFDTNTIYLSSNRFERGKNNDTICCSNIYSFFKEKKRKNKISIIDSSDKKLTKENIKYSTKRKKINSLLPLKLFFHNNEPEPGTKEDETEKTYQEAYVSYFKKRSTYMKKNKNNTSVEFFFEKNLKEGYNNLNILLSHLLDELERGAIIEIQIKGYSSPLHDIGYNKSLSKRRINSLVNYILQFNNLSLSKYLRSNSLKIEQLSFGESKSATNVSDDPKKIQESIYSIPAMLERKIEIIGVIYR